MVQFTRVLCPIDLSELSIRPLVYANAIARWYDAQLTMLHVVPTFDPIELRGDLFEPVKFVQPMSREEVLDALRVALDNAGVPSDGVTLAAEAGEAVDTIVDQSVARKADLLVMGTHGRSGFNRLLLGSVTENVLRKAPCPVLTVPPHAPDTPHTDVRLVTILCAMDFSPSSLQAFGFALDLARRAGGTVIVLYAVEWLAEDEPRELVHFSVPEVRQHMAAAAQGKLAALIAGERGAQDVATPLVAFGRPYREILQVAGERAADLIVMGARGRGGPALTPFGSTTQQVVRAAACPVLTVREPLLTEES